LLLLVIPRLGDDVSGASPESASTVSSQAMVGCRVSGVRCRVCVAAVPHIEDVDTAGREGDL
jgi:hypothetical protein